MDTRQYGPALFATVKQVRDLLEDAADEAGRHDVGVERPSMGRERGRSSGARAG